jgi:hypothetical protein
MRYGIHVLNTKPGVLEDMQGAVSQALLNSMGYNRNTPEVIRHGPMELGGVGILSLETVHNTSKINHILQHLRMGRMTGQMIKVALEWAQVIAGTQTPILEDSRVLHHLTEPWIAGVQQFLAKQNSSIQIASLTPQITRRDNDQRIMEFALQNNMRPRDLQMINNCRLYLQVENISDITNNMGTHILSGIAKGERCGSTSSTLWPVQARPAKGNKAWELWRKLLAQLCSHGLRLRKPLGLWHNTSGRKWTEYYDPETHTVSVHRNKVWQHYSITNKRRTSWKLQATTTSTRFSTFGLVPCEFLEGAIAMKPPPPGTCTLHRATATVATPTTWTQYVQQLPVWERDLLRFTEEYESEQPDLVQELHK